jgi:hypothetical protein
MKTRVQTKAVGLCVATVAASALSTTACSRAPSLNILGSFFPAWLLCGLVGIVLAAAARVLLVRLNVERELSSLVVFYPSLAALFTFSLWLLFFS